MALENRETLLELSESVEEIIFDTLEDTTPSVLLGQAMRFETTQKEKVLKRVFSFTQMKEWVGERELSDAMIKEFTVTTTKFQDAVLIERDDIATDELGLYETHIRQMAEGYPKKRSQNVVDVLLENPKGYDEQPLFSTAHPLYDGDGSTYSNDLGATTPLDGTNFDAAVEQMELITDHRGNPLNIQPDLLVIGPKLRSSARSLFDVERNADGSTNEYFQQIRWTVDPRLGTHEGWYLLDTSWQLKPFIIMDTPRPSGQLVEYQSITDPNDSFVFDNDAYKYGISARWGMTAGVWQTILRANV